MAQQVLEGTWDEITRHAARFKGKRVRLTILDEKDEIASPETQVPAGEGELIRFGMFPQLQAISDEDFKRAEYHGDSDSDLA